MRKITLPLLVALAAFITACNNETTTTNDSQGEKNMAASRAIANAFQTGNTSAVDSFIADDFVDHTDHGDVRGKDSLKAMIKMVHENMRDMKSEVVNDAASGDYVYTLMRYTGTSDGSMGMPVGPYDMKMIELSRFKDGKAIEHWAYVDWNDAMKMMKASMPPADTTKKK